MTDAQIFHEFLMDGGNVDSKALRNLNALTYTTVIQGRYSFIGLVIFKDGSTWTYQ